MFLRNYDNYMVAANLMTAISTAESGTGNSTTLYGEGYYNHRMADGSIANILFGSSPYWHSALAFAAKAVCLGNGSTDVTYDDYKLSGDVIANKLVEVSKNVTYNATTHKFKRTLVATYTNTDSSI